MQARQSLDLEIDYASVDEFVELWTRAKYGISARIVEFINMSQTTHDESRGLTRLHWSIFDFLVLGLHDFSTPQLITFFQHACKDYFDDLERPPRLFCVLLEALLQARLSACNGVYVASMRMHDVRFNSFELGVCLQGEVDRFLGRPQDLLYDSRLGAEERSTGFTTSEIFLHPLKGIFHANFTRKFASDGSELVLPNWRWRLHLLAIMMGSHERLGRESWFNELDVDLLQKICKLL